MLYIISYFI